MTVTMAESTRPNLVKAIVFDRSELKAVRASTLLLIGENEVLYKPRKAIAIAEDRLPGLRGEVIPKADHLASLSAPADINKRILQFLVR